MYVTQAPRRHFITAFLLLALSLTMVGAASAAQDTEVIPLPDGFQPEGIASGNGTTFFVGSIPTGSIYRGDVQTGEGELLVEFEEEDGRAAIGLKFDSRTGLLFVAGGPTGNAYVYDAETGETVAEIQLETEPSFINDVVVTKDAAYFTNSSQPFLYKVALENNGELPETPTVEALPLGGDFEFTEGEFNANGITATRNGKWLIVVNSFEGALYRVDPKTGDATRIDLGDGEVPNGDGLLLLGEDLYVVQNFLNQVAVVELNDRFTEGQIERTITDELFRIPTTIASFGNTLCVVNARFDTDPMPDTEYEVVCFSRR
jgi:sugar lactone lactonase YvrE